jgi:predicted  nucleic acid-binding Zn-ribbon protein
MEIPTTAVEEIEDIDKVYRCPLCGRMAVIHRNEIDIIEKELGL